MSKVDGIANEKIRKIEEEYKAKFEALMTEKNRLHDCFKNEIKLKDLIIKRHKKYTKVLQSELILAKEIIKNPNYFNKVHTEMKYKRVDLSRIQKATATSPQNIRAAGRRQASVDLNKPLKFNFSNNKVTLSPQPTSLKTRNFAFCSTLRGQQPSLRSRRVGNVMNTTFSPRDTLEITSENQNTLSDAHDMYIPGHNKTSIKVSLRL
ncbi:unnamed protein product [Moneuplotes crassus]|uniref:Uncharacterized protein n=1 Tax=Euplotes crassus TaxID=5936 RepID=A0AAD1U1H3_EUPCR|nr:unnamed protein product [Moneuplotes crassus]